MPRYHTRGSVGTDMSLHSKESVIEAFCQLAGVVNENVFHWGYPSDCFCAISNEHPSPLMFSWDKHVWDFIKDAIEGAIQTEFEIQQRVREAVLEERESNIEERDELEAQLAMTKLP